MAWSLEKCDGSSVENAKMGLVRPATEDYAEEAIGAVKAGEVIAVPTDTLYGFACDACSVDAVHRMYETKGRKYTSPLAICVEDVKDIQRFVDTDHLPIGLLDSLLPGPVTVVLRRGSTVVDLTKLGQYKILRPGSAEEETIEILERTTVSLDKISDSPRRTC
ncbi:hypothetical protein BUALT_Bualt13G0077000 [Buddleja alternifolia]|uniref:Threonylcarbamoyl-AMP synthase n=1 Tax=Buddleja alternifolia TaxID=168488 RepID=A0AAV6WWF5_9LAMI|nr:hypothetical protein BUALT_Bualt13G0077000 [Buddleja alternifolia]